LDCFPEGVPLSVWLGPAIGPDAFEVGEEVRQIFIQCNAKNIQAFRAGSAQGKWWADIYQLASLAVGRHRNAKRGNISINGGNYCTVSNARLFHSHRRDGARSGRMVTLAWMNTGAAIP
jgi:copper oxidase (laccase) domain-containing protein